MALFRQAKTAASACPYCFVSLDCNSVGFRCAGIPASSRRQCVRHPDRMRQQVLGDANPVLPPVLDRTPDGRHILERGNGGMPELKLGQIGSVVECDRCGGRTSSAICPNCHSLLPEEIAAGPIMIGVVGARNSGKTVLLSLLEQQLISRLPSRFDCAIDHPGGTVGLASELQASRDQMELRNQLPHQTISTGARKKAPAVYNWKQKNGSGRIISIYDTAGEDVANRDTTLSQAHLLAANAIFFVVDPFPLAENRRMASDRQVRNMIPETEQGDVLDGLVTVLRQGELAQRKAGKPLGKVSTPVAVIVTKIDAFRSQFPPGSPLAQHGTEEPYFNENDSLNVHEHVKAELFRWGGASLVNKLESEFANYRFFAVSALGSEPDYGSGSLRQGPSPSRVADPLLWVLAQQGLLPQVPTRKNR